MMPLILALPVRPTAQLFEGKTDDLYFALDGHLNAEGARRVANLLLTEN